MPTPTKGKRLGGSPAHERAMLANLATSLFEHGRITTTETRARRLRPFAERLITKARRGDLHARRQVMRVIRDKTVVHVLFTEIGPRFDTRPGGYTRITKVGPRPGDNAPMAVIELVEEELAAASQGSTRASRPQAAAAAAAAAEEPTSEEPATGKAPAAESDTEAAAEEAAAEEAATEDAAADAPTEEAAEVATEAAPSEKAPAAESDTEAAAEEAAAEEAATEDAAAEAPTEEAAEVATEAAPSESGSGQPEGEDSDKA